MQVSNNTICLMDSTVYISCIQTWTGKIFWLLEYPASILNGSVLKLASEKVFYFLFWHNQETWIKVPNFEKPKSKQTVNQDENSNSTNSVYLGSFLLFITRIIIARDFLLLFLK